MDIEFIDEDIDYNKLLKDVQFRKLNCVKPPLKWVGGKTQIIDKLISKFPIEIENYHEIFLGGGCVLLTFLTYVKNRIINVYGKIYAYDLNDSLIYLYKNIQTNYVELYNELQKIICEYNSCDEKNEVNRNPKNINEAKICKENYYYWIRNRYNKLSPEDRKQLIGSSMFLFLNKTCFRGMYRVGPNGFNVPYGNYKNPEIVNLDHLQEISELIQNVIFECCDFNNSLQRINRNDFVYLDPPYAPENKNSFVGYTQKGFDDIDNIKLFQLIHKLTETDIKIMMNNSDVKLVRDNFTNKKYNIESILCKRLINSKNPESKSGEVIITNY